MSFALEASSRRAGVRVLDCHTAPVKAREAPLSCCSLLARAKGCPHRRRLGPLGFGFFRQKLGLNGFQRMLETIQRPWCGPRQVKRNEGPSQLLLHRIPTVFYDVFFLFLPDKIGQFD